MHLVLSIRWLFKPKVYKTMPHFRWRGVTIDGAWRSGRACAVSAEQLTARMLQRGVAVTTLNPVRIYSLWYSVPRIAQAQSLETVALLVQSGMPLVEACVVAAETIDNPLLQECWVHLAASIERGEGITDQAYLSRIFGAFIAHLLILGYRSGTFYATARICAQYARASHELKAKLRSALAMPALTLLFVFGLLWLLFAFLVPSLTALFNQFNATLPLSTRIVLAISEVVQSPCFFYSLAAVIAGSIGIFFFAKQRGFGMQIVTYVPFIGTLCAQWQRMLFVQALHALLQGGTPLPDALNCIAELMASATVRRYATQLGYAVSGGVTFSDALATTEIPLSTPLMIAMARVGQESNQLTAVLAALAERESAQFLARLQTLTVILQPTLIILLGFVVLAVIGAIYMPLINVAHVVQ